MTVQDFEIEEDLEEEEVPVEYDIATYPSDLTLSVLHEMWRNDDIVIPEFQREFVWTIKQSSMLIESFLLGLPVPPVFFYIDENNQNLVIDGQQRILSVAFFLDGFFGYETLSGRKQVFRLEGLGESSKYHKKRFVDLEELDQRKLKSAVLRAINVRQLSPTNNKTSIYHIFERLNTGGTALKSQEIRNVVFRGGFVGILRDLNRNDDWRKIIGKTSIDKHQRDVELVLRVFALSRQDGEYEKPMKEFLNKAMERNQKGTSSRVKYFEKEFKEVSKFIVSSVGVRPFHLRGPLNSSALDSVFCTLMDYPVARNSSFPKSFDALIRDEDFSDLTQLGTTDTNVVRERFEIVRRYLLQKA
ncbi:MAG: DUF262 domain-containing protein [Alphaproteobacteria bacterium]|jgi:uncharacterized protein with ParB-like and HNH nuclease domain|nr:DUF262 domain-containing protein [Alphaproteobacteria bacterium]